MAGNATLTTVDGNWNPVNTDVYIQSIETGSNIEFDDNQVHKGMSYRPIRRLEMFLDFTAVWSLQNYYLMDSFQEAIMSHFLMTVSGSPTPMTLNYYGTSYSPVNLTYSGWIELVDKSFPRFDDIFVRSYRMNILLPEKVGAVLPVSNVKTAKFLDLFGNDWYQTVPVSQDIPNFSNLNSAANNPFLQYLNYSKSSTK